MEEFVARTDGERYFSLSLISGHDEQQLLFYGDGGYALIGSLKSKGELK